MSKVALDKNKKYDRQLRLWGDHGQEALEGAKICLITASATGTEILKNLILPGIGSFTIVDGEKVTGEDVGNNFFLDKDCIGKSRAECTTELLLELNSDVSGDFIEETTECLLRENSDYFKSFTVVIATQLPEETLLKLGSLLWSSNIPLLVCHSYGFIGCMRIVLQEHCVVESHPDSTHPDLRLDRPFPGLVQYVDALDLNTMTKQEHGHTPYVVLLLKYLNKWKAEHKDRAPQNYKEKDMFKQTIRGGILVNKDGIPEEEENFDEAIRAVNTALVPTRIPCEVSKIFADDFCSNFTESRSSFWILAKAVKEFVENEGSGALPLRGSIPDMTADSKRYIELQNIYQEQARKDIAVVTQRVHRILLDLGKSTDSISDSEIRLFCKNAAFLRLVRGRSLAEESEPSLAKANELAGYLEDPDSNVVFYILLKAVDRFYSQYHRHPGNFDEQVEADVVKLKSCLSSLLQEWSVNADVKEEYVHEMCRYGASELHPVAAFIGGAAAQEIVKLVTHQFVPFNDTYIYNGITGSSTTLQL
ncbi:NEDD8-activating enzyme E1 regulatory subunit-like [Stylophora pistillata]|uniref:NEDD8-activating enzyme E1 regulatory subunit n=1 Tax=Stylophora pistillata TaxID=50429 RepID=A0A2B4SCM3_STYPI|nr:NEDD8-activating enzyme E1 regulatory subunit-like [Stylophora pistillata]PFX26195.1 NEDD8-activating enzyme E1 regulatory subunit [Stylophora pistillata]